MYPKLILFENYIFERIQMYSITQVDCFVCHKVNALLS